MSASYQIIPQGSMRRPKIETHIWDNTEVSTNNPSGGGTVTSGLFVFTSPKGRDGKLITITNGLSEFVNEFGIGAYSVYGQPLLNAYNAARAATSSNAMLHCLRVTADDAGYSTATVFAKYKLSGGNMNVHFVVKPSDKDVNDLEDLETCCTASNSHKLYNTAASLVGYPAQAQAFETFKALEEAITKGEFELKDGTLITIEDPSDDDVDENGVKITNTDILMYTGSGWVIINRGADYPEEYSEKYYLYAGEHSYDNYLLETAGLPHNTIIKISEIGSDLDPNYIDADKDAIDPYGNKLKVGDYLIYNAYIPEPGFIKFDNMDDLGYTPVKLFTVAYVGKGEYGKNIRFRITSDKATDKNNDYKNYNFEIYRNENVLEQIENHNVTFVPDAIYNNASIYTEDVVNDIVNGSNYVTICVDPIGFKALYDVYKSANPDTLFTLNDFDALLGRDKYTREAIPNYIIEAADTVIPYEGETAISLEDATGISLTGGTDGSLAASVEEAKRKDTANALYKAAFEGKIDENIKSKNRYPSTFIYDANFDVSTKLAIVALAKQRTDCVAVLDFGLDITTKASVSPYYDTNFADVVDDRIVTFEPYCMKVRDPYSQKTVTVTSTYWMASEYFAHINGWNGKHRPLAGNRFGIISGYIANSVYPVFDEDLDTVMLDELAEKHCNVAKYNQNQVVVRSMQNTAQSKLSALSELNNVLLLLDVKRDCERACAMNEYDFMEPEDIARFNITLDSIANKYAGTQLRSIGANFDSNSWEAERGILHLYVEMVHKDIVKTTIIEIDVNRSSAN